VEQISGTYADSSWADVVDNVAKADEGLARVRTLLAETQVAADHSRQHYFRAVALVEEAVRQEDWIEGLYAAITDRRAELDELRASLPKRHDTVRGRVTNLQQGLERQRTDRVRANERAREAGRLLEVAEEGFQVQRPDLRRVGQVLEAADTAATRGEELAAEDDRLARGGMVWRGRFARRATRGDGARDREVTPLAAAVRGFAEVVGRGESTGTGVVCRGDIGGGAAAPPQAGADSAAADGGFVRPHVARVWAVGDPVARGHVQRSRSVADDARADGIP
jgi:hypothetical protein